MTNLLGACAWQLAGYRELALPIHVLSLKFLFEWPMEIRYRMLERTHQWKRRRLINAGGIFLSLAVAISMAFAGFGVYALIVPGMFVAIPFAFDLFVYAGFRPTWAWSWHNYRDAFRFGVTRLGAGASTAGRQLIENTVFSSMLGFATLGLVNRSVGLSQLVCGRIASQIVQAVYPILTRLEARTGQAAIAGDLLMQGVSWVICPLAVAIGALALPAISLVYGPQWREAADIIKWPLAWTVVMSLMQVAYALLLARQQARMCLVADLSVLVGTVICLLSLLPISINAYFAGLTFTYVLSNCFLAYFLLQLAAMSRRGIWTTVGPPLIACVIAYGATTALLSTKAPSGTALLPAAAWGITFLGCYVICLRVFFSKPLRTLVSYFPARRRFASVLCLSID
jgi:O-antigen/teichoic acid export membrane protein